MADFDPLRSLADEARLAVMSGFDGPAKRLHWAAFASSALFALLGLAIMWIARDQSMGWATAWYYAAHGLIPCAVMLAVGFVLRRRYFNRLAEREALVEVLNRD